MMTDAPQHGRVKKLLMGQSFFVVVCSFTLANLTTFEHMPNFLGMHEATFSTLVRSGLPGIIIIINMAQLTPSLLAKEYPLRCLNIPGMYSTIYAALSLESCGVVHFVYVLYGMLNYALFAPEAPEDELPSHHPYDSSSAHDRNPTLPGPSSGLGSTETDVEGSRADGDAGETDAEDTGCVAAVEPVVAAATTTAYIVKVAFSTLLTVASVTFVVGSIGSGHSSVEMSVGAAFMLALLVLAIVTYCEGLKVAVVSTTHLDSDELTAWPTAQQVHRLLNKGAQ